MGFTHLICQATLRAEQQRGPLEDSRPPLLSVPSSRSWKKLQENKWRETRLEENAAIFFLGWGEVCWLLIAASRLFSSCSERGLL